MLRTHTCGELRIDNVGEEVVLTGWVQRLRDKGGMLWIDLRDRYGITQLTFEDGMSSDQLFAQARGLGREYVIKVIGKVIERYSKNDKIPTGDIELHVSKLEVLNPAKLPPFMIEDETDGGDDLRMKYRYLDLRRTPVRRNLELRHQMMRAVRAYLDEHYFIEVETPVLNAAAALILSMLILLSSCHQNKGPYAKDVLVIGHAGSGFFSPFNPYNPLPANSMASIVKAMEEDGADGVEVDVHVSKDGIPILYHDTSLETMSEGEGMIEQLPAAEVVGLRYKGGILYDLFHSEKLITLEDMLQRFEQYPELPYLHVDLRNHDASRNSFYAESLLNMLRRYNYPNEKMTFISPDIPLLQTIREIEPEATLLVDAGDNLEIAMQDALANKLQGIAANGKKISQEQLQRARQQGLQVVLFGGKSGSSIAKMLEMEPDAIEVNNVKRMRALINQN